MSSASLPHGNPIHPVVFSHTPQERPVDYPELTPVRPNGDGERRSLFRAPPVSARSEQDDEPARPASPPRRPDRHRDNGRRRPATAARGPRRDRS
ncbi:MULTISPECIES: hypothetical protein [Prauserella]|uniref:Uncharacterized protein n=1 Tax=Prauserella endophytica TaxID=1592324 RepID=A0ABY2S7B2_9PSEU|nr:MULTISPECIES: hypothetical protein [Prauserella]TKG71780.1 hypothetical protein FCN18_09795 [Prauserella endophytica]